MKFLGCGCNILLDHLKHCIEPDLGPEADLFHCFIYFFLNGCNHGSGEPMEG